MPLPFLFPTDPMESQVVNEASDTLSNESAQGWQGLMPLAVPAFPKYLSMEEELQISQQFQNTWRWNRQVMWSGLYRDDAQAWADKHDMATLTTAMGPLMDPEHPQCLKAHKSDKAWSKYIKGASAVFAYHILRGERVVLLSPPPPERFHPSGETNYQAIEEPVLKRSKEGGARLRIETVHPMIGGAEDFIYEMWPIDMTDTWTERFGALVQKARCWRAVKGFSEKAKDGYSPKRDVQIEVIAIAGAARLDEDVREALKKNAVVKKEATSKDVALKENAALKKKAELKEKKLLEEKAASRKKSELKEKRLLEEQAASRKKAELKEKRLLEEKAASKKKAELKEKRLQQENAALEKKKEKLEAENALKEKVALKQKAILEEKKRLKEKNALKEKNKLIQKVALKKKATLKKKIALKEK